MRMRSQIVPGVGMVLLGSACKKLPQALITVIMWDIGV